MELDDELTKIEIAFFEDIEKLFETVENQRVVRWDAATASAVAPPKVLSFDFRTERQGVRYFSVFLEADVTGREDSFKIKDGGQFTSDLGYCFITDEGRSMIRFSDVLTETELREMI